MRGVVEVKPATEPVEPDSEASGQAWWLYLLECTGGTLYAGISPDPAARFERHQAGTGAKYTRANRPVRILAVELFPDRSTASIAEHKLKRLTRPMKLSWARDRPSSAVEAVRRARAVE